MLSVVDGATDVDWLTWNVTSIVKNWYSGQPNYGLTISDINRGSEEYPASNTYFYSNDYFLSYRPKLIISYRQCRGRKNNGYTQTDRYEFYGV